MQTVSVVLPIAFDVPIASPAGASLSETAVEKALVDGLLLVDPELIAKGEVPEHPLFTYLCNGDDDFLYELNPRDPRLQDKIVAILEERLWGDEDIGISAEPALAVHQLRLAAAYMVAASWVEGTESFG